MIRVVVAPTGAGKTTSLQPLGVVDADSLPAIREAYSAVEREFGPMWWDNLDYHALIAPKKLLGLTVALKTEMASAGATIATAELSAIATLVKAGDLKPEEVLVWVPTPKRLAANHLKRAKEKSKQPSWPDRAESMVWDYLTEAARMGCAAIMADDPSADALFAFGIKRPPEPAPQPEAVAPKATETAAEVVVSEVSPQ